MEHVCKTCGKSFKHDSSLSRHVRIHKALRIVCGCGLSFSRRDNLNRHQLTSSSCRALELSEPLESNVSCEDNIKIATKDEFTQTANYPGDDIVPLQCPKIRQKLTKSSKDNDTSTNSLPPVKKRFEAPSEDDEDSDISLPNFKNRKMKHRLKKHKFKKSHIVDTTPSSSNLFSQYGCPTLLTPYIRKLNTTKNFTHFKR